MKSVFKLLCLLSAGFMQLASAQGNFVTIIGPDGRPINIPIESDKPDTAQPVSAQPKPLRAPAVTSKTPSSDAGNSKQSRADTASQLPSDNSAGAAKPAVSVDDFIDNDGVEYVDSELLIEKQFNLSDKKRFFSVPNQLGSIDYIERTDGQDAETVIIKRTEQPVYRVAENYSVLPASVLKDALPVECLTPKQISKAETFSKRGIRSLWPIGTDKDFEFELIKLSSTDQVINLQSYESKSPGTFYWPLSVFLDHKGCVLQGVATYLTQWEPSTWIQKSSLKGVLLAPEDAQYLLLTPMAQMPFNEEYALSRSGSITLQIGTETR